LNNISHKKIKVNIKRFLSAIKKYIFFIFLFI